MVKCPGPVLPRTLPSKVHLSTYPARSGGNFSEPAAPNPGFSGTAHNSSTMSRAKKWVFTLNNYTQGEIDLIAGVAESEHVDYLIFGKETGENGTPHLQGYVIFSERKRLSQVRAILSTRAHYEVSRGTPKEASDYCKKDNDYTEFGALPGGQGTRTDWDRFKEWVTSSAFPRSEASIASEFPSLYGRYRANCLAMARILAPPPQLVEGDPRDWQSDLEQRLLSSPDDRSILFVVDPSGGSGKSWFCSWWISNNGDETQVLSAGKRDDIAHAIDPTKRYYFFDVPRGGMEYFSYGVLEQLKNRIVFAPKYESCTKILHFRPHVVVMSNEHPDMDKLTPDRYVLIEI